LPVRSRRGEAPQQPLHNLFTLIILNKAYNTSLYDNNDAYYDATLNESILYIQNKILHTVMLRLNARRIVRRKIRVKTINKNLIKF